MVGSLILDLDREDQIKAIEGRLQLSKGKDAEESGSGATGASRVF